MFPMPDVMTIWNVISDDGFGNKVYSDPLSVSCRIAYKQEEKTDENGDVFMSKAVFYTYSEELKIDSKVLLGIASVSTVPDDAADDLRMFSNTPSGAGTLRTAWF